VACGENYLEVLRLNNGCARCTYWDEETLAPRILKGSQPITGISVCAGSCGKIFGDGRVQARTANSRQQDAA
jgi:hypothetical protein